MAQDSASSQHKIAANRENSKKSSGPRNTSSTRFNAVRHSLLASGITELDDAEGYRALLDRLKEEKKPDGALEKAFVESIALETIRIQRSRRLDAEYITGEIHPPIFENSLFDDKNKLFVTVDPGIPANNAF
jgi:hypothetical protein